MLDEALKEEKKQEKVNPLTLHSSSFEPPRCPPPNPTHPPTQLLLAKALLLLHISRVFLQLGNLIEARRFLSHADLLLTTLPPTPSSSSSSSSSSSHWGWVEAGVGMGKGLLALAEGRWVDAAALFEGVAGKERTRKTE